MTSISFYWWPCRNERNQYFVFYKHWEALVNSLLLMLKRGYSQMNHVCCCTVCEVQVSLRTVCQHVHYNDCMSCQYCIVHPWSNYDCFCGAKERTRADEGWRGEWEERGTKRTIRTTGRPAAKSENTRRDKVEAESSGNQLLTFVEWLQVVCICLKSLSFPG